jgi:hypothetical protein
VHLLKGYLSVTKGEVRPSSGVEIPEQLGWEKANLFFAIKDEDDDFIQTEISLGLSTSRECKSLNGICT